MSTRSLIRRVAVCGGALLLAGCVSAGHRFSAANVPMIRPGVTTQAEVRQLFGAPWRSGLEDGQKTWTYGYYRYSLFGDPVAHDLVVRFDDAGRVESYTFSSTLEAPDD